jgi:hypothetical protein
MKIFRRAINLVWLFMLLAIFNFGPLVVATGLYPVTKLFANDGQSRVSTSELKCISL